MPPDEKHPPIASFDPFAPDALEDPHRVHRELRERCPIVHGDRWGGFWALTRYDDILAVTKQHELFINSVQNVVPGVTTTGRRPPLHLDPPEHTLWRKAMSGPFKLLALSELEPKTRALTVEMLTPLLERGHAELMDELAGTLPVLVLCAFLNAPPEAPDQLRSLSDAFLHAFQERDGAALETASRRLYAVAADMLDARRQHPLDPERDMASALLSMRVDGEPVSDDLMQGAIRQLLIAGHVAVTMMLGSCVRHLAENPALQQMLRDDPTKLSAAIDELLRLYTPNQAFCRTSAREVELHGQHILPGQPVVLMYPSANRDETKFDAPEAFRFGRPVKHIAFGNGVHKCPGEQLARLELRVFLEELLSRTESFELAGPVELARWPEYGPKTLPVRFVPGGTGG